MGFLKALGKLTQATIQTALTPVDIAHDIISMGGTLDDRDSYTIEQLEKIKEKLEESYNALDEE